MGLQDMNHVVGNRLVNNIIFLFCAITVFCSILTSCDSNKNKVSDEYMQYLNVSNIDSILGKEYEKVLSIFSEAVKSETISDAEEIHLSKEWYFKDTAVKIKLIFLNNVLFRIEYDFGSQNEAALNFANEAYLLFSQKYGKSDTYQRSDRIEGLSFEEYRDGGNLQYIEHWTDKVDFFDSVIPEEYRDTKRVDLGIRIDKRQQEDSFQTVVYVGGMVNSIGPNGLLN